MSKKLFRIAFISPVFVPGFKTLKVVDDEQLNKLDVSVQSGSITISFNGYRSLVPRSNVASITYDES